MLTTDREPCVVHVADASNREALQTLSRTMPVIAAAGVHQILLKLPGDGADVIGPAPLRAEVRTLRVAGALLFGTQKALQAELSRLGRERSLHTVHLHGLGACLLGSRALKRVGLPGRVLCSPHLSGYGSAWASALLAQVLRPPLRALQCAAVTASPTEAWTLSRLLERSAEVLPHYVNGVFFEAERRESRQQPNVLADGWGTAAVDLVSRLSVLLNSRGSRVRISWLGALDSSSAARISAASIEPLSLADDAMRARSLAGASAFVYASALDPVPLAVAQAMAAGVPVLVSDTPSHRALVRHGETGLLCSSAVDFLEKLIVLLRNRAERERIGAAARAEAERWFTLRHFERAVLRAYGFHVH